MRTWHLKGGRNLTKFQRDQLIARISLLRDRITRDEWSRRPCDPTTWRERHLPKVCSRLRLFIAGVETDRAYCAIGKGIQDRMEAGETTYLEYLDELRWLGMDATPDNTIARRPCGGPLGENAPVREPEAA